MTLKERITEDMKAAMRARDTVRLDAIRLLRAAVQRREVDDRTELDDRGVLQVVHKLIRQSADAADQFTRGDRKDLAEKEQAGAAILQAYLPEPLSDADLDQAVRDALAESGADSMKDMGRVMALVKDRVEGRADMKRLSEKVKSLLQ